MYFKENKSLQLQNCTPLAFLRDLKEDVTTAQNRQCGTNIVDIEYFVIDILFLGFI